MDYYNVNNFIKIKIKTIEAIIYTEQKCSNLICATITRVTILPRSETLPFYRSTSHYSTIYIQFDIIDCGVQGSAL